MILMHRAALGGVQLDSVDSRIMVKGVSTSAPREREITSPTGGNGTRYVESQRESLEVSVRFGIRLYDDDMDDREEVMEKVMAWANNLPAWLTTTQKPGRRIWVEKAVQPAPGDPSEWTNEYTLTFRAYAIPYWQDSTATSKTLAAGDSNAKTFTVPGNTDTPLNMELTNGSGSTISSMTIQATGGSRFVFSSLGLAANEKLITSHDARGYVQIQIKNTSNEYRDAMEKRAPESSDDLTIQAGTNKTVTITAGGTLTGTISCNGRYA